MKENLLNGGFHDAEIYGFKINKDSDSLELWMTLPNKKNMILSFKNPIFWEFNFVGLQNSVYEISIFEKNKIPDFLLDEYPALIEFKNHDYYNDYKLAHINPSVGLEGVIWFETFQI